MEDIQIIDDALPAAMFYKMQHIIFNSNDNHGIPYTAMLTTYNDGSTDKFVMTNRPERGTSLYESAEWCLTALSEKMNYKIQKGILRIQFNLFLKHTVAQQEPHVDNEIPHQVAILYMNDSDGDTILYNEMFDPTSKMTTKQFLDTLNPTEAMRVTPKANRVVVFNGNRYHSSGIPVETPRRSVINYNFGYYK